ncbi:DNA-processing protein DprA [Roseibacillus ishigakijimensis]|uniref:DNA-protecting protein DprA n=1 Tax=Roseibacillus ishigakijimensis TaxID=454146 RepID=A0A934RMK7_9BACT|nr:DNA-processing protein DprA [Roseibacillus ishigakijimensis]MBK1833588.1 DNA-protecting protein DprA [Roseibacillus ishigakijimensis]
MVKNDAPMLESLLTLNALPKVGPIRLRRLLQHFGDAATILRQPGRALQEVNGIGPEVAAIIAQWQNYIDPAAELALCEKHGISLLTPDAPHWPRLLAECSDAPLLLYVQGEITAADQHALGVVGSRRCTHYGRSATRQLTMGLAKAGYTIISGLARGIDAEAHRAALAAGGRTIAVLGSGLLNLYPSENRELARQIAAGQGAVVSEFPLRQPPDKQTFPQRNRIVANWASALLVTESPRRSGSLITAGMANEAGRTVYAVPGPIDRPQSEGCHDLIRDGATLATCPEHLLEDLQNLPLFRPARAEQPATKGPTAPQPLPPLSEDETSLLAQLETQERTMDQLAEHTNLPIHRVSASLLALEMKGLAKQMPGQRYVRATPAKP